MKAFINTPITKKQFIKNIKWHMEQDAIIKVTYGKGLGSNFKGCAVGCSLSSIRMHLGVDIQLSDHSLYEKYLGAPKWLAKLEDFLFERLPSDRPWTLEFSKAINVGADLDKIKVPFIVYIMEENLKALDPLRGYQDEQWLIDCKNAVYYMIFAQESGDSELIDDARSAVESAVESAVMSVEGSATRSVRWSVEWPETWSAIWSVGRSAVTLRIY